MTFVENLDLRVGPYNLGVNQTFLDARTILDEGVVLDVLMAAATV